MARVREAANWTGADAAPASAGAGSVDAAFKLAYAAEGNAADPYAGFEARIVPENITLLPKTAKQTTGGNNWNERVIAVKKGDTHRLRPARTRRHARRDQGHRQRARPARPRRRLKEGQKLRVLLAPAPGGQRLQPIRVIIASDTAIEAVVALSDLGKYVSVDVRNLGTEVADGRPRTTSDDGTGVRLYQSIYETALRNQLPAPGDRRPDPHLLLRRRFPAQGAARRFLRGAVRRRRRDARRRSQAPT